MASDHQLRHHVKLRTNLRVGVFGQYGGHHLLARFLACDRQVPENHRHRHRLAEPVGGAVTVLDERLREVHHLLRGAATCITFSEVLLAEFERGAVGRASHQEAIVPPLDQPGTSRPSVGFAG